MKLTKNRWRIISLLLVAFLLAIELAHLAKPDGILLITRLDSLLYDARFSLLSPQRDAQVPIVLVDIDELSIQQQGRWPWPRNKVAELVSQLQHYQAGLIGLDIIFSEPSPNLVEQLITELEVPGPLKGWLTNIASLFNQDQTLAETVSANTILGYFFQNDGSSSGQLPFPFYQLDEEVVQRNALLTMDNYTASIPLLADYALGQGFVVTVPDRDGVVRRAPMFIRYEDSLYSSLALTMAQIALGAPWLKVQLEDNGTSYVATQVAIGPEVTIPVNADGSVLVPFKGYAGSFPTLSATEIMQGKLNQEQQELLAGAIVLVGTSALGLSDLRTMPLQTSYPGVEVHANTLDAILQTALGVEAFYQIPDWSPAASFLLMLLTGLLLAVVLPGRSPVKMLALSITALALVLVANLMLWHFQHLALPLAMPLILVFVIALFNLSVGFIEAGYNKHKIQNLFGAYVPPEYVKQMLENPETATMDGEQREMSVLFADVMGFTSSSEKLTTSQLKDWLNRYLTAVTQDIFQHQGTIDKYVGDMVMAFWNAPLADEQHAQNAVLAAMAMQATTRKLESQFQALNLPPVKVGIGINTGVMNVGDMGSHYRRAYTVLGDAVNLGSRLEGLTRFYGVDILVSQSTKNQCPDIFFMPVDRIQVKGKNEPVDVYVPLCLLEQQTAELDAEVDLFKQALAHYRQAEFQTAEEILQSLVINYPQRSVLYSVYLERSQAFKVNPPAADWQAVYIHTSK